MLQKKYKALCAGFGLGKSWGGTAGIFDHFNKYPGITAGYFAPSYPMIRDIFFPLVEEVGADWGYRVTVRTSDKEVDCYRGGRYAGTVICRSMENPSSIIGFKIGHALVDEIDTMPIKKAEESWRKIIARMRYKVDGLRNGIDVVTTPEGFRFVYNQFHKLPQERPDVAELYGLVRGSTYENAKNLPPDYISSLIASYPPQLISAYINGEFVNLTQGSVYTNFDRIKSSTLETIKDGEPLHIGMDFNVTNMSAVVCVIRGDQIHAVRELVKVYDTPAMIEKITAGFPRHHVTVYPDASGDSRKSVNASDTDISLLRSAKFSVKVDKSNPRVKDRIMSVNAALSHDELFIHPRCKETVLDFEQLTYDANGEPDKTLSRDHRADALGYLIHKLKPVVKPLTNIPFSFAH